MIEDLEHYVYIYTDPRKPGKFIYEDFIFEFEPFYVGKGVGNRYKRHLNNSSLNSNHNPHKEAKLKKLIKLGYDPLKYVICIAKAMTENLALFIEREAIRIIGRHNLKTGPLCNQTDGGVGMLNHVSNLKGKTYEDIHGKDKADKLKQDRSIRFKGCNNPQYGKHEKRGPMSEEQKIKLSNSKSKAVYQVDKITGQILAKFKSTKEAALTLGIGRSGIHNCLSKSTRAKSAGGYIWKYV